MSIDIYGEILSHFGDLTAKEQEQLVDELSSIVAGREKPVRRRSVLELRGLGREIWQEIDTGNYVRTERDSWLG